jgi:hypothetical protein
MNLVQVQEHLKDVPLQALMGYANGSSQMVPPYLALGEMNRRKQMEKRAAEPPKSTVKDELEQQAQPPAMMPNQAMMQPPMEEMATEDHAYGGITGLPSRFQFDGGGIVSFADGSKDAVKEFDEEGLPLSKSQKAALLDKKLSEQGMQQNANDLARLRANRIASLTQNTPEGVEQLQEFYKPRFNPTEESVIQVSNPAATQPAPLQQQAQVRSVDNAIASQTRVPPVTQVGSTPSGIGGLNQGAPQQTRPQQTQVAAPSNPFMDMLLKNTQAELEKLPDFEAKRKAAEAQDAYLTKKPGELMETEIANQRKRQEEARQRFEENEKARTRSDLWANLIKAGKATAGRKGIGALVGGYGEASIASEEEARQRREQFENLDNEKNLNFTKMNQEIENARIARSEGRFKDAYTHEVEAKKFEQNGKKMQAEAAQVGAQVLSGENIAKEKNLNALEVQRLHGLNNLEVQRLHNLSANRPGETERLMAEYGNIKASKGEAAAEEYMKNLERIKTGSRGATAQESLAIRRQALLDKNQPYQMASMQFYSAKDPDKKAKAKATMDAIEQKELGISPSAVDTSGFGEPRVKSTK